MTYKQKGFPMHSVKSALKQKEPPVGVIESMRRNEERIRADIEKALDEKYPDRYIPGTSIVEDIKRSAYSDEEKETKFPLDPPKAYRDLIESRYRRGERTAYLNPRIKTPKKPLTRVAKTIKTIKTK